MPKPESRASLLRADATGTNSEFDWPKQRGIRRRGQRIRT